jgi:F-box/WD-40 domain protein 10
MFIMMLDYDVCIYLQVLNGHHEGVTAIQFDRWHIVTAGRDGYALVWSAIGDHNRCLSALRHPK